MPALDIAPSHHPSPHHRYSAQRTHRTRGLSLLMGGLLVVGAAGAARSGADAGVAIPIVDAARPASGHPSRGAASAAPAPEAPPAGAPAEQAPPAPETALAPPPQPDLPPPLPMYATSLEREQALFVTGQGWGNGHLPSEALDDALPGCRLLPPAAARFAEMLAFARMAGHAFRVNDCYRDVFGQEAMRWEWCVRGACQNAAVPGYSSHGNGLAVDVGLPDRELNSGDAAYAWLTEHGPRFGFRQPDWALPNGPIPEPWHWEYFGPVERRW